MIYQKQSAMKNVKVTAEAKIAETSKAILFTINSVNVWVPKSLVSGLTGLQFSVPEWFYAKQIPMRKGIAYDIMPVSSQQLKGWDGHSRRGQSLYDAHFAFEMGISEAEDIIRDADPEKYTQQQIADAYATIEKFR